MPCRNANAATYRYGFNGIEKDDEIYGNGNSYTAEFWQYDPRLGRRWNIDPLAPDYPWQSPYAAFNNNPIYYSDPTGLQGDPPDDQQVIKTGGGEYMNIPAAASVETFGSSSISTTGGATATVDANAAKAFTVDGNRYVAGFNKEGGFSGYYLSTDLKTQYSPEALLYESKFDSDFKSKLLEVSYNLGHDPNKLLAVMAQETGDKFKPDVWNGNTAVGLIQFTSIALTEINKQNNTSYTKESVSKMTAVEQLNLVQKYYQLPILKNKTFKEIEDYAIATFAPAYMGKGSSTVIYKTGDKGYKQNKALDTNGDGNITVGEVGAKYGKKYVKQ
jgi:RHS repeat-associated protein